MYKFHFCDFCENFRFFNFLCIFYLKFCRIFAFVDFFFNLFYFKSNCCIIFVNYDAIHDREILVPTYNRYVNRFQKTITTKNNSSIISGYQNNYLISNFNNYNTIIIIY